jgi:hypothetical protein
MDLVYLAILFVFFTLSWGLVELCAILGGAK